MKVRRARRSDAADLVGLVRALADFEKLPRPSPAAKKRLINDCFGRRRRIETYLAVSGGTPVGYAMFFETYSSFLAMPTLYLEDLFVLPGERGRGIGRMLFRACVEEARRRGCGRMEWVVLDWNTPAVRFYRRLGARHLRKWNTYRLDLRPSGRSS